MKYLLTQCVVIFFVATPLIAEKIVLNVSGMTCSSCAQTITETFKAKPEIKEVAVSVKEHRVSLEFNPGKVLSESEIKKNIESLGYEVVSVDKKD